MLSLIKGGGWKSAIVDLTVILVHEQFIHCIVDVPGQNLQKQEAKKR